MTVLRLRKSSRGHFNTVDFPTLGRKFICQHFKIILKDINDFIRLQSFLNSKSYSINEFIKFFFHLIIALEVTHLSDEIVSIVLTSFVYTSSKVGLSLNSFDLTSGLEAHFKHFLSSHKRNVFYSTFHIHEILRSVFIDKIETILSEQSSLSSYSHLHERS